jgi:hypothetical protein
MSTSKVVLGSQGRAPQERTMSLTSSTWTLLWWIGILLVVAGLVDLLLAFYPPRFSEPTWRFTVLASVANGLPLPLVGLLTATMAGLASERPGRSRIALFMNAIAAIGLLAVIVVFATSIDNAFQIAAAEARPGLNKAVFKTLLFSTVFCAASAASAIVVAGWLRKRG